MLSRVANAVYWYARYLERAENIARLISVNTNLVLDTPKNLSPGWQPLIMITGGDELFSHQGRDASQRNVVQFLVADPSNPGSIVSSLTQARDNARTIRDIVPREAWEAINDLCLYARDNVHAGLAQRSRYDHAGWCLPGSACMEGFSTRTLIE
jgi:uncharacterized alpha-E superfamily protein